jgi:hypothetical protein
MGASVQVARVMITAADLSPLLLGKFDDIHAAADRSSRLVTSPTKTTHDSPPMSRAVCRSALMAVLLSGIPARRPGKKTGAPQQPWWRR